MHAFIVQGGGTAKLHGTARRIISIDLPFSREHFDDPLLNLGCELTGFTTQDSVIAQSCPVATT